ncbi:MAG: VCBS repeat-containing protein [Deltaproteobacteria bacterium]|nr:VCBS repeat-containing protein [Deltaproteobacteria bacterium]
MPNRSLSRSALLVAVLLAPLDARAEFPYPKCGGPLAASCTDPTDFASYLFLPTTVPPTVPSDLDPNNFRFSSLVDPAVPATAQELFGVRGPSVDKAWQVTTGRPDVVIAILDSGLDWSDGGAMNDLATKVRLHAAELPLPESTSNGYDRNEDGVFDVRDYRADGTHAGDSRVVDANGNGIVDPQDLLRAFSDGTDADANGYVDDIAGWDFHQDDNDPYDDVHYGHGTGEAEDSTAEAANGGGVGTAPNATFIPIKVSDSFVSEVNDFARGVVFAVDSGAAVIQEANGALDHTAFGQDAIDYAYARGVPVIASAADEESYHHNWPSNYEHTIPVNSIRAEDGTFVQNDTYLLLNGCTNYGAHNVHVSVPSNSCSSEATGRGAGIAALIVSRARNLVDAGLLANHPVTGTALSANEVKQILGATADDIDFSGNLALSTSPSVKFGFLSDLVSTRFPTHPGRDKYFGYGRVNADRAVRALSATTIPPEAELASPGWFHTLDPTATPMVTITGSTAAHRRANAYTYTLEYGCGVDPVASEYARAGHLIATGTPAAPIDEAILGTWAIAAVAADCAFDAVTLPVADRDRFDEVYNVTLRLRVVDDLGNVGEDTRAVAVFHDPDLHPGFPRVLHASGDSSPALADLDGDGTLDVVLATAAGEVHAIRGDGSDLQGWPATTDLDVLHTGSAGFTSGAVSSAVRESILGSAAVGDLDRDGALEVVVASTQGKLYVFAADGTRRAGFPVSTTAAFSAPAIRDEANRLDPGFLATPALADLDRDGTLEIVIGASDRHLYVWRADGTPQPGFPILMVDRTVTTVDPMTGKVAWDLVGGQPRGSRGTKIVAAPAIGDIDGDGFLEIVQGTNEEYVRGEDANVELSFFAGVAGLDPVNGRLYAIDHEGSLSPRVAGNPAGPYLPGWPVKIALFSEDLLPTVAHGVTQGAVLGDVDGDGIAEVVVQGNNGPVYVLRGDGSSYYGIASNGAHVTLDYDVSLARPLQAESTDFPISLALLGSPSLADLDSDGRFEVIAGTIGTTKFVDQQAPGRQEPGDHQLSAWRTATGHMVATFPRIIEDMMFFGNPAVFDLDDDGVPEVVQGSGGGFVHAVNHLGAQPVGWPKFTNGWMIPIPVAGDLDGDGLLEVATASREGFLYVWDAPGAASARAVRWQGFRHDRQRTGALGSGVPAGLTPAGCDAGVWTLDLQSTRLKNRANAGTDSLRMRGTFVLAGNALDFETEPFELRLAGSATVADATVAAGLPPIRHGFKYRGPAAGGGTLSVRVTSKDGRRFKVTASVAGIDATGSAAPEGTTLVRVGDDCFAATLPCAAKSGGQSEVCKGGR